MQDKIAILLPYKDQFIKDNAGSASIWVKDFSKKSRYKAKTTIFGFTNNTDKIFNNFKYINLKFSKFGIQSNNLQYVNKIIEVLKKKKFFWGVHHFVRTRWNSHMHDQNLRMEQPRRKVNHILLVFT